MNQLNFSEFESDNNNNNKPSSIASKTRKKY